MSRIDISTRELFLRLGSTPQSRSARADKLFRRLRSEEAEAIVDALIKPSARVEVAPAGPTLRKKKSAP
jgi:hypothetical protein